MSALTREELALLDGHSDAIVRELLAERRRQVTEEGWTPKHDERHVPAELAGAAAYYAGLAYADAFAHPSAIGPSSRYSLMAAVDMLWPWDPIERKPKDARRNLVRAGALIVAALERLDREAIRDGDVEAG